MEERVHRVAGTTELTRLALAEPEVAPRQGWRGPPFHLQGLPFGTEWVAQPVVPATDVEQAPVSRARRARAVSQPPPFTDFLLRLLVREEDLVRGSVPRRRAVLQRVDGDVPYRHTVVEEDRTRGPAPRRRAVVLQRPLLVEDKPVAPVVTGPGIEAEQPPAQKFLWPAWRRQGVLDDELVPPSTATLAADGEDVFFLHQLVHPVLWAQQPRNLAEPGIVYLSKTRLPDGYFQARVGETGLRLRLGETRLTSRLSAGDLEDDLG